MEEEEEEEEEDEEEEEEEEEEVHCLSCLYKGQIFLSVLVCTCQLSYSNVSCYSSYSSTLHSVNS
jgi:hypothetical protein